MRHKERHIPVLYDEVLRFLDPVRGGIYGDFTFGSGGHTEGILRYPVAKVVGIDRDRQAFLDYRQRKRGRLDSRLELVEANFAYLPPQVEKRRFDGIVMDLGVRIEQLSDPQRGFSFRYPEAFLDMRMDDSIPSLYERLERANLKELEGVLGRIFSASQAQYLSRRLLEQFRAHRLKKVGDLMDLVSCLRGQKRQLVTRLFLALRLWVNDELLCLEKGLENAMRLLKKGGRLVVISFHSLEDQIVKRHFRLWVGRCICQKLVCECPRQERVKILTPRVLCPSRQEQRSNPRARSAKLRAVEKVV